MTALSTRDALAKSAAESIMYHPTARTIPWSERETLAKVMGESIAAEAFASGAVVDATTLADDVALIEHIYERQWDVEMETVRWWGGRRDVVRSLRALTAALTERGDA